MKKLIIFLVVIVLSLSNCATKNKIKQIEKINQLENQLIIHDSISMNRSKLYKLETTQNFNEFEHVLKALNIQYDGEQDNELKVTYNRTDKGTELNLKGKGKATYDEYSEKEHKLTRKEVTKIFDSIVDIRLQEFKANQSKLSKDNFRKDVDKKKLDFSFWIYAVFGIVVIGLIMKLRIKK